MEYSNALMRLIEEISQGQKSLGEDVKNVQRDLNEVKVTMARVDGQIEHVQTVRDAQAEIEHSVRTLEDTSVAQRARDKVVAAVLGAATGFSSAFLAIFIKNPGA